MIAIMLFCCVFFGGSEASAASTISVINLYGYSFPYVGANPWGYDSGVYPKNPNSENNPNYEIFSYSGNGFKNGIAWTKVDSNGNGVMMSSDDKFESGYKYTMYVAIKIKSGSTLTQYTVSGFYHKLMQGLTGIYDADENSVSVTKGFVYSGSGSNENEYCTVAITWNNALTRINDDTINITNLSYPWTNYIVTNNFSGLKLDDNRGISISNGGSYNNSPRWYDYNDELMSINDKFEHGKKYTIKIPIKASAGYSWPNNATNLYKKGKVFINGYPADIDYSKFEEGLIFITKTYTAVRKAELTDTLLDYPLSESAYTTPTKVGDWTSANGNGENEYGYTIDKDSGYDGVTWYNSSGAYISKNAELVGGSEYKVRIYLKAKPGYAFDFTNISANSDQDTVIVYESYKDEVTNKEDTTDKKKNAKVKFLSSEEGKTYIDGDESYYGLAKKAYIERTYKVYPRVREIVLNGFTKPNTGTALDFSISTPSESLIKIEKNEDFSNIAWFDVTNGSVVMKTNVPVEAGHKYEAVVKFREKRHLGFAFADNYTSEVKIDMGGEKAPLSKVNGTNNIYQSKYTFNAYQFIKSITFNIKTPKVGEEVYKTATCVSDVEGALASSISSIDISEAWEQKAENGNYVSLTSSDIFKAGNDYVNNGLVNIIAGIIDPKTSNDYVSDNEKYRIDPFDLKIYFDGVTAYSNGKLYGEGKWYYQIPAISISDATVSGITDKEKTGEAITQDVTVKLGDSTLVKDTDYTVAYENNIEIGTATITITGIGEYTGEIKKTFEIKKKEEQQGGNQNETPSGNQSNNQNDKPNDTQKPSVNQDKTTENPSSEKTTTEDKPGADEKKEDGVGTFSADGKTLTDENGNQYKVSSKMNKTDLKKNQKIADKKSGGKYKITKLIKNKKTGKVTGGTVEYVAPYNKNTKLISATGKVKLCGVTFTVTSIAPNAAKGCKNLAKVVLGENIATIGKNAFNGCSSLKSITIKSKKLRKVGAGAFKGINKKATISVPKAKKKAYTKLLKGKGQAKTVKIK